METQLPETQAQSARSAAYRHADYSWRRRVCRFLLRHLAFTVMTRVDRVDGTEHFPASGPAIMMINHIAFVDPLVMVHISPRDIVPMAKEEAYHYPVIGIFPRLWGVIPVTRAGLDRKAIQLALDVLAAGEVVLVAPEGTRGPALQQAKEGAAYLASRSGAPILPTAITHTIGFPTHPFSARWREPGAHVRFGRPFAYKPEYRRAKGDTLRLMADEAMYLLASILPQEQRGYYADADAQTLQTIAGYGRVAEYPDRLPAG